MNLMRGFMELFVTEDCQNHTQQTDSSKTSFMINVTNNITMTIFVLCE